MPDRLFFSFTSQIGTSLSTDRSGCPRPVRGRYCRRRKKTGTRKWYKSISRYCLKIVLQSLFAGQCGAAHVFGEGAPDLGRKAQKPAGILSVFRMHFSCRAILYCEMNGQERGAERREKGRAERTNVEEVRAENAKRGGKRGAEERAANAGACLHFVWKTWGHIAKTECRKGRTKGENRKKIGKCRIFLKKLFQNI